MVRSALVAAACCSLALTSCAEGSSGPSAGSADFTPTGTITSKIGTASFNATRVVGPKVNVSQRNDGTWGGTIGSVTDSQGIDATYKDGALIGGNLKLYISKTGNALTVNGQWRDRIVRFEISPTVMRIRSDTRSYDLQGDGAGNYTGSVACTFTGEAAALPPTPIFALALVGAFM